MYAYLCRVGLRNLKPCKIIPQHVRVIPLMSAARKSRGEDSTLIEHGDKGLYNVVEKCHMHKKSWTARGLG